MLTQTEIWSALTNLRPFESGRFSAQLKVPTREEWATVLGYDHATSVTDENAYVVYSNGIAIAIVDEYDCYIYAQRSPSASTTNHLAHCYAWLPSHLTPSDVS